MKPRTTVRRAVLASVAAATLTAVAGTSVTSTAATSSSESTEATESSESSTKPSNSTESSTKASVSAGEYSLEQALAGLSELTNNPADQKVDVLISIGGQQGAAGVPQGDIKFDIEYDHEAMAMAMKMNFDLKGMPLPPQLKDAAIYIDGKNRKMYVPAALMMGQQATTKWVEVPIDKNLPGLIPGMPSLPDLPGMPTKPGDTTPGSIPAEQRAAVLAAMMKMVRSAQDRGLVDLGGEQLRKYELKVDLAEMTKSISEQQRKQMEAALGGTELPVELFVSQDNKLRMARTSLNVQGQAKVDMLARIAPNADVTVTMPDAKDVTKMSIPSRPTTPVDGSTVIVIAPASTMAPAVTSTTAA